MSYHIKKIEIKKKNKAFLSFQTISNIIFNKDINYSSSNPKLAQINPNIIPTNNLYQSEFLKHLIRFPFFKKEIKASNYSFHKIANKAYIINNEIINKLKLIYDLKKVINVDLFNILNNITYSNVEQNYPQISKILYEKNIGYINNIKQLETTGAIQFKENERKLNYKYLYNNFPMITYIDNIELIDENFALFLNRTFNNSLMMFQTHYVAREEKILMIINVNQSFIYEIASFNQIGGDFNVEYLIKVKYDPMIQNTDIVNYLFNIFATNGIQKLIMMGNTINIGNNILINFHQIKNNLNQSLNIKNSKSENNKNIYTNKDKFSNSKLQPNYNSLESTISNTSNQSNYLINNQESFNAHKLEKTNNFNPNGSKKLKANKIKIENDTNDISDRLKVLLLLALSHLYNKENTLEKAYLINPEWLGQYNYKKIKSIVDDKSNQIIQIWNSSYDLNSLSKIIQITLKIKKIIL